MNIAKSQFHEEDAAQMGRPPSPSKDQASPSKSSLSKGSRYGKGFDPQNDIWSEYGSAGHRHAKSVTFDHAPPQVNEYEMTTPGPSSTASESRENSYESEDEGDISFEHESSIERDDSFDASLEDIEKTPVVLPEDWRFMSPSSNGDDSFIENVEEDSTDDRPISREGASSKHTRVESLDSNGERRPLPPLPSVNRMSGARPSSAGKLTSAFELGSAGQRGLPAPPAAASYNKSDIIGAVSLEDRLRLMMLQEKENNEEHDQAENAEEPLVLPMVDDDPTPTNGVREDDDSKENFFSPPRISRDSILRGIRKGDSFEDDDSFDEPSQIASSPHNYENYDPDVPIPSLEMDDDDDDDDTSSVIVKQEEREEDLYSITDYYQNRSDNSLSSRDQRAKYDEDSNYSLRSAAEAADRTREAPENPGNGSGQTTPIAEQLEDAAKPTESKEADAADGASNNAHDEAFDMTSVRQSMARPVTPEMQQDEGSEPSTPDSVIRHPVNDDQDDEDESEQESFHEENPEEEETEHYESSSDESVPEPVATIRAPGAGLKTRPSLTPADMQSMAATRRKISGQHIPPVPPLTKQPYNDSSSSDREQKPTDSPPKLALPTDFAQRQSSLMQLDIPFSIQEESLGSGLNKEFDRVIESQKVAFHLALSQSPCSTSSQIQNPKDFVHPKIYNTADPLSPKQRGYLMRQNTKVVMASSRNEEEHMSSTEQTAQDPRGTRSAGSSPRKPSQQTWTTVPWNGSARRSSIKHTSGIPKKKPVPGAGGVPPLPGQASNVQEAPATIEENEPAMETFEEGEERGRLFVKVVGLKYCDLPLPRGTTSRHTFQD
jgi:hypothetical protein